MSDTKVDMLYAQIPQNILKKISAEFNINLGIISLSLKKKDDVQVQESARYEKLKTVTTYIKNNFSVGTVESPSDYFEGTYSMRYGEFGDLFGNMVFFGGITDHTWLALAGSAHHMIGAKRRDSAYVSSSLLCMIERNLLRAIGEVPNDENIISGLEKEYSAREKDYLEVVVDAISQMRTSEQILNFLARRLNYGEVNPRDVSYMYRSNEIRHYKKGEKILLGTPLYVALVS